MVIIMVMIVVLAMIMTSSAIMAGDETGCHHLLVQGADKADCNGEYFLSNASVSWAPNKPVYKHVGKDR